jgi:hypothetical protein
MANNNQDIALLNNDLVIVDGDLAISFSDQQHIQDTINAFPGWWKENPADGVGLFAYLGGGGVEQQLSRAIKIQLRSDGYSVSSPKVSTDPSGKLLIDPNVEV